MHDVRSSAHRRRRAPIGIPIGRGRRRPRSDPHRARPRAERRVRALPALSSASTVVRRGPSPAPSLAFEGAAARDIPPSATTRGTVRCEDAPPISDDLVNRATDTYGDADPDEVDELTTAAHRLAPTCRARRRRRLDSGLTSARHAAMSADCSSTRCTTHSTTSTTSHEASLRCPDHSRPPRRTHSRRLPGVIGYRAGSRSVCNRRAVHGAEWSRARRPSVEPVPVWHAPDPSSSRATLCGPMTRRRSAQLACRRRPVDRSRRG